MEEWYLPLAILIFGTILVIAEIRGMEQGWGPMSLRIVGLTVIITAALFLVMVPASFTQLTPERFTIAFGLLATSAGYLFGKS